jgi:hypothetical protein
VMERTLLEPTACHATSAFPHMIMLPDIPIYEHGAILARRLWLREHAGEFGVAFTDNGWGGPGEYAPAAPYTVWFRSDLEAALFRLSWG